MADKLSTILLVNSLNAKPGQSLLRAASLLVRLGLAVSWALGAIACQSKTNSDAKIVRIGFFASVPHAAALLALDRGDFGRTFETIGWTWEPVVFGSGPEAIEALYAGRVDIAYVGPAPAINGYIRSAGREIVVIAGAANNGVAIAVRPDSPIRRVEDLAGAKVAVPSLGNTQYLSATAFLSRLQSESREKKVHTKIIPVSSADAAILLEKKQVDAVWLPEPWPSRLEHEGKARLLVEEKELWPGKSFPSAVVAARRKFTQDHPEVIDAFLAAHRQVLEELNKNTQQAAPLLALPHSFPPLKY